jgi:hypothetical protein
VTAATPRPPLVPAPAAPQPAPMTLHAHVTPATITEIGAVSFLLCGAPGSGKTEFGCNMPAPLFFQWDSNMKTLEKHPEIPYVVPSDWMAGAPTETSTTKVFSERVLPLLEARRAHEIAGRPVESIVFDTGTEMGDDLALRIIGVKTNQSDSQARFGEFLREAHQLFRRVADLAKPRGELPRYNVAVLFHLTDVTDDKGNLLAKAPAIIGRVKGELQRRFDVGLLMRCRAETAVSVTSGAAPGARVTTHHFEACSVPPDRTFEGLAFDRVGGKGPWTALPAVVTNPTYAQLVELWKKGGA